MEIKIHKKLLIDLEKISYSYPGSSNNVLDNLTLKFYQGDHLGLIAPNGSGKTTLFHIIMGLLKPRCGQINIYGNKVDTEKDFRSVRKKIGFLFQDADDQLFCPTVIEDVAFGPLNLGKSKKEAVDISHETLDLLGLNGFENRITFKLSGGEKRLVSLASVLAMQPEILLLDEPTTGLDINTKERLIEILTKLDLSYIVISHEFDFISAVSHHLYTMEKGKIITDEKLHIHQHIHGHKYGEQPHKHHDASK
ncbi:MAG: ABC transporter ATP-binding protein [Desulfobacteraceae bacterium 4572_19]|nr:MAG: ABC transporter ATP-binding protein [Desulfobacteraceae bacterium 4572_19]